MGLTEFKEYCDLLHVEYRIVLLWAADIDGLALRLRVLETDTCLVVEDARVYGDQISIGFSVFTEYSPVLRQFPVTEYVTVDVIERLYGGVEEWDDQRPVSSTERIIDTFFDGRCYAPVRTPPQEDIS